MSLTWVKDETSKPIAKVKSEDERWNGKVLYVSKKPPQGKPDGKQAFQLLGEDFFKFGRLGHGVGRKDIEMFKEKLLGKKRKRQAEADDEEGKSEKKQNTQKEERLAKLELKAEQEIKKRWGREIKLPPHSSFVPIPNTDRNQHSVIYIFGPGGAGKSVFCAMVAKQWARMHKDKHIFLISCKTQDPNLDHLPNLTQIVLDDAFVQNPPQLEELRDSLVIFDDFQSIDDPAIEKAVQKLLHKLLHLSRQDHIDILITSHIAMNWHKTKAILADCNAVVGFPSSGSWKQFQQVLQVYASLNKDDIQKIKTSGNHWQMVATTAPTFSLGEHSAFMTD